MPWVAACVDLLVGPILGYCLAVRKLALQASMLQDSKSVNAASPIAMAGKTNESNQEKSVRVAGVAKSQRKFNGVVVATCGLPARGKTLVAYGLARRLNWNGESAKVMRVSDYRRKKIERYASHELFRPDHVANAALRAVAQKDAMQDCAAWLASGNSVAILDATLITLEQRSEVLDYFSAQLGYRVLFIECVCEDPIVIEENCREILKFNADYTGMDPVEAMEDLTLKIEHYRKAYQPLNDPSCSTIKIDTGTMEIQANKLGGHIEATILGYLGSITLKPHTLYFSRHGESEFNVLGKIGGDAALSLRGERYAQALASRINAMRIPDLRVFTSRLKRTIATARGVEAPQEHIAALNELHAGVCDGLSYEEMQEQYPQEFAWRDQDKLRYRYPWGESYIDTMQRVEPVIVELQQANNVLVISHQAILRCIIGFFLDKTPEELPYMEVPLHTIIRMSSNGFGYKLEFIKLPIECVNTTRLRPQNCSANRTADDALLTVPMHFDIPDPWRNPGSTPALVQQH